MGNIEYALPFRFNLEERHFYVMLSFTLIKKFTILTLPNTTSHIKQCFLGLYKKVST